MAGVEKSIVLAFGVICIATALSSAEHQQAAVPNVAWEQSQSLSVRLSIKGHEFAGASVEAECVVVGPPPLNMRSRRRLQIERDKEQLLYFPEDFHRKPVPGEYRWGCAVGERKIAEGRFEYLTEDQARVIR